MIPVFKPSYSKEELKAVKEVFESGWIGLGPKTKEFEDRFAEYIGVNYAVATNSATAALHLALKVIEIEGKEVITTPITFVSTNHAILYNNGIPVFADIYPDTLNINPQEIKKLITKKTKAIILVHYGGHPCDMEPIMEIARDYGLVIIEDAAHACGAEYKGRKAGSLGQIGCFSFHAVKNLATGDGGMITTNDEKVYQRLLKLRWMGISKDTWAREDEEMSYSWYYNVEEVGFKCHMNDITAAIGIVQLAKLEKMNERRKRLFNVYNEKLQGLKWIETPVVQNYARSAYHNYVIKSKKRDDLNSFLKERGIATGVHYIPNNHYSMFKDCRGPTPIAEKVWRRLLTLPLYPDLKEEEVGKIVSAIKELKSA
jgi:perosamine synthetase